jgi:TRAP-type C4-dicarboxylate transport system permease small subunit
MGGHVKVDIFLKIFPEDISNIIQKYINIFGFIICGILFIFSFRATFDAWSIESLIIKELILKEWLLLSLIPFTTFILSLEFIFQFFKKNLKDNNDAINNSIDGF